MTLKEYLISELDKAKKAKCISKITEFNSYIEELKKLEVNQKDSEKVRIAKCLASVLNDYLED